jgi:hypothetical protein
MAAGAVLAAGCDKLRGKKSGGNSGTAATQQGAADDPTVTKGPGGGVVVAGGGGGGSGGAVQAVRKAAKRTEVLNEMNTLGQVIADYDTTYGKMPNANEIKTTLRQYPKVLALVNDGSIVLTGTSNRGGCWAYQYEADTKGGIVLIGGRATRMTADEAAQAIRNR